LANSKQEYKTAWTVLLIFSTALVVGCGIGGASSEDVDAARQSVSGIGDAVHHPARFSQLYVSGSAPSDADRSKFGLYRFWGRTASLSADTATVTVEVTDRKTNQIVGDVEWTIVKQDGKWKFKDTPLPEALPVKR